ncbi:hypothetical protein [Puniceicoccus vermicola]|uniref:hypothetical protein n=1 Tax=Puniceicoccus vermicola TaxID=388746 RepID=UPI00339B2129
MEPLIRDLWGLGGRGGCGEFAGKAEAMPPSGWVASAPTGGGVRDGAVIRDVWGLGGRGRCGEFAGKAEAVPHSGWVASAPAGGLRDGTVDSGFVGIGRKGRLRGVRGQG